MGNLLRLLARDDCCSVQKYDIFLDFESKYQHGLRYRVGQVGYVLPNIFTF